MFDFAPGWGWLFLAYALGTAFGIYFLPNYKGHKIVESTVDNLIANGYLKHRKTANGDVEILKYNED